MLLLTIITAIVLSVILINYKKLKSFIIRTYYIEQLPGPPKSGPIVGNVLPLHTSAENIFKIMRHWARTYFPIFKLSVIHISAANILSPEDCELILSNPKHIEKSVVYDLLHDWLGTGLLNSGGEKWQIRRKILTPAFHFNILQVFINIFNEETTKLVEIIKRECADKESINIVPHITQFALKTITETAMGTKLDFQSKSESDYKKAIFSIGEILVYKLLHPWAAVRLFNKFYKIEKKALNTLHSFTKQMIDDRESTFKDIVLPTAEHEVYKGKKRLAMLDLLLSAKHNEGLIDNEGIREEVDTFTFEGHDTTSMAICFALMLIACHKNIQEQLVEEMEMVMGSIRKKPDHNDLQELKLMERCIKETLRLYPSVHFISRKLGEDLVTKSGYFLAKGSMTHLHIYDLHHNPDFYPDPERFDPDRFLPENSKSRHHFAYLPFSAGPRNCIGQRFAILELKAVLCGILSNFILEPVDTPTSIILVSDIILRTKNGIKIKFVPR